MYFCDIYEYIHATLFLSLWPLSFPLSKLVCSSLASSLWQDRRGDRLGTELGQLEFLFIFHHDLALENGFYLGSAHSSLLDYPRVAWSLVLIRRWELCIEACYPWCLCWPWHMHICSCREGALALCTFSIITSVTWSHRGSEHFPALPCIETSCSQQGSFNVPQGMPPVRALRSSHLARDRADLISSIRVFPCPRSIFLTLGRLFQEWCGIMGISYLYQFSFLSLIPFTLGWLQETQLWVLHLDQEVQSRILGG